MRVDFVYSDNARQIDSPCLRIQSLQEFILTVRNNHATQEFERHAKHGTEPIAELLNGHGCASAIDERYRFRGYFAYAGAMGKPVRLAQKFE